MRTSSRSVGGFSILFVPLNVILQLTLLENMNSDLIKGTWHKEVFKKLISEVENPF